MLFKIRIVLVTTGCGKKKQNVTFLVWSAKVAVCCHFLVVCGLLLVVSGRLLVVCNRLLVLCGPLLAVCGALWSLASGLWSFELVCGGLWSFFIVSCFTNYGAFVKNLWWTNLSISLIDRLVSIWWENWSLMGWNVNLFVNNAEKWPSCKHRKVFKVFLVIISIMHGRFTFTNSSEKLTSY